VRISRFRWIVTDLAAVTCFIAEEGMAGLYAAERNVSIYAYKKLKMDDVEQAFSYFVAGLPLMKFNSFGVRANTVLVSK
jgi:hypothetical protein